MIRDIVRDVVSDVVKNAWDEYDIGGAIELDLTSTASIVAFLATYSGSYTCASVMWVKDVAGVYQEIPINTPGIYMGIGTAFWPTTTNVIGADSYRDFTHAEWTPTNGSITAGAVTLIDGTSVSDKNTLTASGANCTLIHDVYTSLAGVHSAGLYIKRKTGTGVVEVCVDGSTWVDVTTQVASDAGWHLGQTTLPTVANPQVGVRLVTSGDAVYLDWAQMDDGFPKVSIHPIGGGVTLAEQAFIAADATNGPTLVTDAKGAVYAEAQLFPDDFSIGSSFIVGIDGFSGSLMYIQSGTDDLKSYDGTTIATLAGAATGYSKLVSYWGHTADKKQLSGGGSSSALGNYDGSWSTGAIYIGKRSNASVDQFNGIISKVIFYPNDPKTQAEWEVITA